MHESEKVQYLIVDTSAFIRNAALQDIGVNIITEQDVVNEITNKRQLRRLVVLPYDLAVQNAYPENIKFVAEFAKRTGDYTSLSATDIKVIALTYQLEKEKVGTEHLRNVPEIPKTVDSSVKSSEDILKPLAGFYMPEKKSQTTKESNNVETTVNKAKEEETEVHVTKNEEEESDSYSTASSNDSESDYETADQNTAQDISEKFSQLTCQATEFKVRDNNESERNVDDILPPTKEADYNNKENDDSNEYESDEDDYDPDDDNGWITPRNLNNVKKEIDAEILEKKPAVVACLTMDFAMQNVLKQMGLNVVALDGRLIKQMRTFIFRCHACFKTTSIMTKVFCPSCGNKTLKKVAVSIDEEGNQQIHINFRKPISTKGKRFSLPMPQGGKHANNPILCEDQPVPDQRSSRLARTKNDPLQEDYIAGYSPFIMRDVYSKSAMLGIRPGGVKYWMKKNPNESRRKRK